MLITFSLKTDFNVTFKGNFEKSEYLCMYIIKEQYKHCMFLACHLHMRIHKFSTIRSGNY